MKRIIVFLLSITTLLCFTGNINAQQVTVVKSAKDTLNNADTSYIKFETPDDAKSIQLVVKRASGTAAGRAVLKASNDGVNFIGISTDTLTFSNAATNTKFWTISPLYYGSYYIELISSGTTKLTAKGYMIRRRL
ncbi:hypothetical protein FAM09_24810 [Niastella caeni]|uniref:Uncharacterized protein n=1 Tax=Niastella caeni TaxID=2569763 RepID=A0A4S8HGY8_9BACT|nr:hypothetical protein [Niastella caeni]THU34243.1 hypothetical protein FAM09_24810 [Niastella caeni]